MSTEHYMSSHKAKTIGGLIEAFHIFASYAEKGVGQSHVLSAGHDIIHGPENPPRATDDGQRLEELGWHWDEEVECWGMFT